MNPFRDLAALGYTALVPIIPPDATISPGSSLAKRIGTTQDARGKSPGIRGSNGSWFGFDWVNYEADAVDYDRWAAMGAGVGIRTGEGLHAIDADTLDEAVAKIIRDLVRQHFGATPIRVGRYPKALYLLRVDYGDGPPLPYMRVEFGQPDARGIKERVEVLGTGRQFVAHGIHPKTREPYSWPRPLVARDALPVVPPQAIEAFMAALRAALPNASDPIREGAGKPVAPEALLGDPETVRRAVAATPNTSSAFPSRESYLQMGYAIKGAFGPGEAAEAEAYEVWAEWCGRWTDGDNDPDIVAADWRRMKRPRIGAHWLYEMAEATAPDKFTLAQAHFTPIPESEPSPFDQQAARASQEAQGAPQAPITASPYRFPDPASLPRREWLYGTHYIRKFVSATVAPSGLGKSSLALVEALAMASGQPLLGVSVHGGPKRVWVWNGEDPMDELERRVAAAMQLYGLTQADVGDRLFLDTGRVQEIVLATDGRDGPRIAAPVVAALMATVRANAIDCLTIDPFVSTHRVPENDNGAIDLVTKQWARLADACSCAVELVHHVRKLNGAEITVEDSRGAVALLATSRSARALAKMTSDEAMKLGLEAMRGRLFRFADGKNNLAPAMVGDETEWLELASVALGNGDSVGVVRRYDLAAGQLEAERVGAHELRAILDAVGKGGGQYRRDVRAREAWVGYAVASVLRMDPDDPHDRAILKARVTDLIKAGHLRVEARQDEHRHIKEYVMPSDIREDVFE